jgi:hypothetical protein
MRRTTITVTWNDDRRPDGVDAEDWAYTLRMGGLDAESVTIQDAGQDQGRSDSDG